MLSGLSLNQSTSPVRFSSVGTAQYPQYVTGNAAPSLQGQASMSFIAPIVYGTGSYQPVSNYSLQSYGQIQSYPSYDGTNNFQGWQGYTTFPGFTNYPQVASLSPTMTASTMPSSQIASSLAPTATIPMAMGQTPLTPSGTLCTGGRTVIFLDVDGVLHSTSAPFDAKFNQSCMQALVKIVRTTGADIVLSSSWRTVEESIGQVNTALSSYGLNAVIGCTPILPVAREEEVCKWLDDHAGEVARWVAIDDIDLGRNVTISDGARRMQEHFVRTDPKTGLTEADASKAIALIAKQ